MGNLGLENMVFRNTVKWDEGKKATLNTQNNPEIVISTPPEFNGPQGYWSPEELFLASINSCIMTTFLYFVEKFSASFLTYESRIEGEVNLRGGRLLFTSITVRPEIRVPDKTQERRIAELVQKSEKYCLISSSVETEIKVLPEIKTDGSRV
ncbi:MAG: OsmC family protein [candidate division Zixibacteria bacterium]|nr:OsmC family protein [candidate division Zixibacteria bacterium]